MGIKIKCSVCGKEKVVYNKGAENFVCCHKLQKIKDNLALQNQNSETENLSSQENFSSPLNENSVSEEILEIEEEEEEEENFNCPNCNSKVIKFSDCSNCGAELIWKE